MNQNKTKINELIVSGHKFKRPVDDKSHNWIKIMGWHKTNRPFKKATPVSNPTTQKEK